jgi:hypothetical protein
MSNKARFCLGGSRGFSFVLFFSFLLASVGLSGCTVGFSSDGEMCGNGMIEAGEMCEGEDFGGKTCSDWSSYEHGRLSCTEDCKVDLSQCHTCGNGATEGPEECDGGSLAGQTCQSLGGKPGGSLSCTGDCLFDLSGCEGICGNGLREDGEVCDGRQLGGHTCESLGLGGGDLGCTEQCGHDYSGCELAPDDCGEELTWCFGSCVDTDADRQNCGMCGNECGAAQVCSGGACFDTVVLNVELAGTGTGAVTSTPEGIDCGASCEVAFEQGAEVTLYHSPSPGSEFVGWSGQGCSGEGSCTVALTEDATVTAIFDLATHELSVVRAGDGYGRVTSSPSGVDCGVTCSSTHEHGAQVTLSPSPATGSEFVGWSGQGCSSAGSCTVTLTQDATVTATFAETLPVDSFVAGGYLAGVVESPSQGSWVVILAPHADGLSSSTLQWRGPGAGYSVEGGSSVWDGYANTYGMPETNHPAATFCRDLHINGYTDWYLPAPKEWEAIFENWSSLPTALQGLDFDPGSAPSNLRRFWSSHEVTTLAAVLVDPTDQTVPSGGTLKTSSHGVFAIRRAPF